MASSYRLKRFTNPTTLKSIAQPLLIQFLQPHAIYLTGQGMDLTPGDNFAYDHLTSILAEPNDHTPEEMLDAFFFVDEVSLPAYFDDLCDLATELGIDLNGAGEETSADLAVRVWLIDPHRIERLHAERFLTKAKSFEYFLSSGTSLPDLYQPADAVLQAIQDDLNDWFETKKRGRGTRVFPFIRNEGVWFLVRHGEPYKREGTITNGESSSIFFRPEKFDVLIYNPQLGEMAIHAGTKGEKQAYCKVFGKHLFDNEAFFCLEGDDGKFTLAPIVEDGRACLACTDVDGIEEVQLCEIQFRHHSHQYHVEVHKADDVFSALEDINRIIPASARLLRASFKIKFQNAVRPRTVVIRPPNITIFDRESDAELLTVWMIKRGFILQDLEQTHVESDAALEVS